MCFEGVGICGRWQGAAEDGWPIWLVNIPTLTGCIKGSIFFLTSLVVVLTILWKPFLSWWVHFLSFEWRYLCRPSRSHWQVALTIGTAQAKQVHLWHLFLFFSFSIHFESKSCWLDLPSDAFVLLLMIPSPKWCNVSITFPSIWLERCEHISPTSGATAMGKNNTKNTKNSQLIPFFPSSFS